MEDHRSGAMEEDAIKGVEGEGNQTSKLAHPQSTAVAK